MHDRKLDFGQLYGYTVCLVAILVFLGTSVALTRGILDLREPPYTETYRDGPSLVSIGSYKLDVLGRGGITGEGGVGEAVLPTDSTFARMYQAERLYRLALSHQASRRDVVVSLVLLGMAVLLFVSHGAWLRSRERPRATDDG